MTIFLAHLGKLMHFISLFDILSREMFKIFQLGLNVDDFVNRNICFGIQKEKGMFDQIFLQ